MVINLLYRWGSFIKDRFTVFKWCMYLNNIDLDLATTKSSSDNNIRYLLHYHLSLESQIALWRIKAAVCV